MKSCIAVTVVALVVVMLSDAVPQHTPQAQSVSILDLLQEYPDLKTELEKNITAKKQTTTPSTPNKTTPTASADNRATTKQETSSTTTTTTSTTTTTTEATAEETIVESSTTNASRRRLRPQRLSLRNQRAKPEKPEESVAEEPEAAVTESSTTTTTEAGRRSVNRLTRLRANRGPLLPPFKKPEGEAKDAAAEPDKTEDSGAVNIRRPSRREGSGFRRRESKRKPSTANEGETEGAAQARTDTAAEEVNSAPPQRNARFGGTNRFRNRNKETTTGTENAQVTVEEKEDTIARPTRLTLAQRKERFQNARSPGRASAAEPEEVVVEEAQEEASTNEQRPRFRNARTFPSINRRSN